MKKYHKYALLLSVLPILSGCVAGTVLGTTAEVAGTAVSIGAKATKTSASIATSAAKKASTTVFGEDKKPAKGDDNASGQ